MRQEPSGDENIALGGDGSCKEAGLPGGEIGYDQTDKVETDLNFFETNEMIRARAFESMKTTSSVPHTKAMCVMEHW